MVEEGKEIKQEEQKVVSTKETNHTEKALKIFAPIIIVVGIIALIWIKVENPKFPLFYIIVIGFLIVLIGGLMFFTFAIFRYFSDKKDKNKEYHDNLPLPASLATLRELANDCLVNEHFCNHCVGCVREQYFNAGEHNERIYVYTTRPLYHEHPNGELMPSKGEIKICINAHYPNDYHTILIEPTASEFMRAIENLASVRSKVPQEETESRRTYNPMMGSYEEVEKKTSKTKEDKPKETKEEI